MSEVGVLRPEMFVSYSSNDQRFEKLVADLAGHDITLWYDRWAMKLLAKFAGVSAAARPTCDEARRGRTWFVMAVGGTQDEFAVCAKAASDTYEWKVLS
jgi:hypothetical protein